MKRGDVYLVSLDPTAGHEQRGNRPVIVVSPAEFNKATKLPVILPDHLKEAWGLPVHHLGPVQVAAGERKDVYHTRLGRRGAQRTSKPKLTASNGGATT